jgi:hypothetical protein
MKNLKKYGFLSLFIMLFSCNGSDKTENLSGGYFLRMEGKSLNDILSSGKGKNEIQPNILRYNSNAAFIIAEQKPNKTDDAIYEKSYEYKNGRDQKYYWIIILKGDLLLGPLTKAEFEMEKIKHNIPKELALKNID